MTSKGSRSHDFQETSTKTYHEGPLDEIFGQHPVFPGANVHHDQASEDKYATLQVNNYLHQVRKEAENDRCVYYATRKSSPGQQSPSDPNEHNSEESRLVPQLIDPTWTNSMIQQFLQLKETVRSQMDSDISAIDSNIPAVPQSASAWRTLVFQQNPPSVQFFFKQLDHPTIIKLVVYFTKWISMTTPESVSRWIFIVFLRLDHPLEYTECSIVRDLGKKARKLLDKMKIEKVDSDFRLSTIKAVSRYTIEMVLVIVGMYYGQKDLLFI